MPIPKKRRVTKTKRNYWKHEEEVLLKQWADKAQCYQWMHNRSRQIYQRKNALYTIPVIIISTLTGTANFAQDRFSDEIKEYVVISTPNRFYPIELHTKLPLLHWLPKNLFRKVLLFLNMRYFADEKNLNLLDKSELKKILNIFSQKIDYKIYNIHFLGFVSNFLVICKIKKN